MSEKLPTIKPKEAVKVLLKAGFVEKRQTGSHLFLYKNSKTVPVPMHNKDLKRGTLKSIIKQSGFTLEDFTKLLRKK